MTWDSLEPVRLAEIIRYWVNQNWPIVGDAVPVAMAGIGWERGAEGRWEASTVPLSRQFLFATEGSRGRGIDELSWNITDVVMEESAERDIFFNDVFASACEALQGVLGEPRVRRRKGSFTATWDVPQGCRVIIQKMQSSVVAVVDSPAFAQIQRNDESR